MHVIILFQGLNVKLPGFKLYTRLSVVLVEIKVKHTRALKAKNRMCNNYICLCFVSVNALEKIDGGSGDVDAVAIGVGVAVLVILVVLVGMVVMLLR